MMTEGRVRAIAAQVAAAIAAKIKPFVSEEQIRSDVEAVIRQMQENGELTGSDLTDEQIAAVQENAEAAAGSATEATNAATAAQTAQGKAETAQAAAESAKSTASQKATEAANAAQTATSKATAASKSATAAGTAKTAAEAAAARAEEAANRLLGVAVVGVIETVNGALSLVLTGVQDVADYTAYYKVVDEEGNETLVEIGQLVPKDETETKTYTIRWVNYGGEVLKTVTVAEGDSEPEYDGPTPTRAEDGQYTYTFKGWDKTVDDATGDVTYTATYTQTAKPVEPTYTNLFAPGEAYLNQRVNGSKVLTSDANSVGKVTTGFMVCKDKTPFDDTTKIYIKGATITADSNTKLLSYTNSTGDDLTASYSALNGSVLSVTDEGNGVISISNLASSFATGVQRFVMTLKVKDAEITADDIAGIIITIDEPITDSEPAEPTNFAIPNETNKTDWSIWCNDARFGSDGGYRELTGNVVTNYVAMEVGDIIRFTGLNVPTTGSSMNQGMHFSDADKTKLSATYLPWYMDQDYLDVTVNDGVYEVDTAKLVNHTKAGASKYFRISGTPTGTFDDVVINVKRNGAWL